MTRITTEEFIRRSIAHHGNKYDYSKVRFGGINKKVLIICHDHGEFYQNPRDHYKGHGCSWIMGTNVVFKRGKELYKYARIPDQRSSSS
jgi:hypothetical protein